MKSLFLNRKCLILSILFAVSFGQRVCAADCQVGDTLSAGESCTYPGTDIGFFVNNDGKAQFNNLPQGLPWWLRLLFGAKFEDSVNVNADFNGVAYKFEAIQRADGSWEIRVVGENAAKPPPAQQPDTQVPDSVVAPTVVASTPSPLTEAALHESVVTLTLTGATFERSKIDIGNALTISGIPGLTLGSPAWFNVDRVSDTKITVELEFAGNIDVDSALTLTLGSDAIANYTGAALTAQIPVSAVTESLVASTASPLTEATLDESVVTLTLSGTKFHRWRYDDALTVSGIDGATFQRWDVDRISDTEVTVELTFSGNIDTDAMLTFSVSANGIEDYDGPALTAQIPVAAATEWVVASTASPLTKTTLDGSVVILTLSAAAYMRFGSDIDDAVTVSGINGVTVDSWGVDRISNNEIAVELEFDDQSDPTGTLTFTIDSAGIANYNGPALTAHLSVPTQLEDGEDGDVNSDGAVSIQDLMLIAASFGQTGQHPADVNGDGVVDIADLIVVAGVLDNAAAAPSLHPQSLEMLTAADVRQWLAQAQRLAVTDITSQQGILFLENLLMVLSPKETILLANYPNPFNPETWIPYQLSTPADVTLTIYASNGQIVRWLPLGHQDAGVYQNRSRAAYWDGRNEFGETVASGVYFYHLLAGDYSATRKMLIRK